MTRSANIIICGAGITGVATAFWLSRAGFQDILLLDERPPLSLTSDRSTECYRNWWPDSAMLGLMNRSIDLMEDLAEESGNVFHMNRRGYLYVTGVQTKIPALIEQSKQISNLGAGSLRIHTSTGLSEYHPAPSENYKDQPTGADLIIGAAAVNKIFPYLTDNAVAALHVRRAGWLSAQQLGMYMLDSARNRGVLFESARVDSVKVDSGRVQGVGLNSGETIKTATFINAAGPFLKDVGRLLNLDLPVYTELHLKAAIRDPLGIVDRSAPLLIWDDVQHLPWDPQERDALAGDPGSRWLIGQFPSGAHTRPEGSGESQVILMLWEYKTKITEPVWPPVIDELYPEVVLRGLTAMIPRLKNYFNKMPRPQIDGGYYTKTRENKPLIGPLEVEGAYVIGAVSGYGIMSACGAADLLTRHIRGESLPAYAPAFELSRYEDVRYLKALDNFRYDGQL